jgi:hypothetical protein
MQISLAFTNLGWYWYLTLHMYFFKKKGKPRPIISLTSACFIHGPSIQWNPMVEVPANSCEEVPWGTNPQQNLINIFKSEKGIWVISLGYRPVVGK